MKKLMLIVIFILFTFSFAGKEGPTIKPWPSDSIEHDLPFALFDFPKAMPYDEFMKMMESQPYDKIPLDELPYDEDDGLTENYSLIQAQSPVKNQGARGQCHNFATTATMEYAVWVGEEKALNFSEQCNAWKFYNECFMCCNNPEWDSDGGWIENEIPFAQKKFMKFEADYPYSSKDPSLCKENYNDAPYFSFSNIVIYKQGLKQIKAAIDKNFVIGVSTEWKRAGWNQYGEYPYQDSYSSCNSDDCGGHAVVVVAYDDDYYGAGKGGFIFKNSWSPHWGLELGEKPAGYGVFPYTYLEKFGKKYIAVSHESISPEPLPPGPGCNPGRFIKK